MKPKKKSAQTVPESEALTTTPKGNNESIPIIADTTPESKGETTENEHALPKKKDEKHPYWWCVVYPESAPSNWKELIQETLLQAYISPLHDKDILPNGTGEKKKPHHHVILQWDGPTTYSNAKKHMEAFGGVIQPRKIASLRGAVRYLCHLDSPDKAPYSQEDVICYNGADYETVISLQSDKYVSIEEMQDFCSRYSITSFVSLNTYARKHRRADWFRALCDGAGYIMREYCKSLQYEIDQHGGAISLQELEAHISEVDQRESMSVDSTTGEVLEPIPELTEALPILDKPPVDCLKNVEQGLLVTSYETPTSLPPESMRVKQVEKVGPVWRDPETKEIFKDFWDKRMDHSKPYEVCFYVDGVLTVEDTYKPMGF